VVSDGDRPFEQLIEERTGTDFIERHWLQESIESALDAESCRFLLVTGEPGAGKTSLASGLARAHPDWPRYFASQADGGVHAPGDVTSFLMSIGHQLARQRPDAFDVTRLEVVVQQRIDDVGPGGSVTGIRISDLTVSPFHRTAVLEVEQRAGRVSGSVTGVEIGNAHLEPRLLEPANLAHLALIAPAEVLLEQDPAARIVILFDALDDAIRAGVGYELLDWLSSGGALPANVRMVITSRPNSALGLLRTGRADTLTEIRVDPADRRVGADLVEYAQLTLDSENVTRVVQEHGTFPDQFHRRIAAHASGNFQYLASYARALNDAVTGDDEELITKLLRVDTFPSSLEGIYAFFAERARADIEYLGLLDIRQPTGDADIRTPAWEGVGQPILGVLTVAREPLLVAQLTKLSGLRVWPSAIRNVLSRLRWLLDVREDRVAFFHQSIGEFLISDLAAKQCPDCHVDEAEWHERIVRYYRGSAIAWEDIDWTQVDRYGIRYIADHVERSELRTTDDLVRLVCPGLLRATRDTFGTDRRFLELADRAATHVARAGDPGRGLLQALYLGVVRDQGGRASTALPPKALGLLARLGRLREALDRATAIPLSDQQFASLLEIWKHARPGPEDMSREDIVELLVETALALRGNSGKRDGTSDRSVWEAIKAAARIMAPRDLERALRLWQRGLEVTRGQGPGDDPPDLLYRAAARIETDIGHACTLVRSIRGNRVDAYVELARRADSAHAITILKAAETCLADLESAHRLSALGILITAWEPLDAAETTRLLGQLRAEVLAAVNDKSFAEHVARAAASVAGSDPMTGRMLLATLDTTVPDGLAETGFIRGIELWTQWGERGRAGDLAQRLLAWSSTGHYRLKVVLAQNLPDQESIRQIEEIYSRIPARRDTVGFMELDDRDSSLSSISLAFSGYDIGRAVQVAREISRTSWRNFAFVSDQLDAEGYPELDERFDRDRLSMLAALAHRCLDRGDEETASRLLEEIVRQSDGILPPGGASPYSECYIPVSGSNPLEHDNAPSYLMWPTDPIGDVPKPIRKAALSALPSIHNISNEWAARANSYFFRDPADMVRAVSFGGPRSLARIVRVLAEREAVLDRVLATGMVRAIADPGERAIGFAELDRAGHQPECTPETEALSKEIDRALAELGTYQWTVDTLEMDTKAWAYLRPDHRVHFELAVRALGCREQDMEALRGLGFMEGAMVMSKQAWASRYYVQEMIDQGRSDRRFAQLHADLLENSDSHPLIDIARAHAVYQEFRLCAAIPGHRSAVPGTRIGDPIYAAVVELMTPAPGARLTSAFGTKINDLIEDDLFCAAAGLVAFAAEVRPEYTTELGELADRIADATATTRPATRVDALSILAAAPGMDEVIDPILVIEEADRCAPLPPENWIPARARARVFPKLLAKHPDVALRQLYQAVSTRWEYAMEILENAIEPMRAMFGADTARTLASTVQRGLECMARDDAIPLTVDGVYLAEASVLGHAAGGNGLEQS
jgi:hypothetical protein